MTLGFLLPFAGCAQVPRRVASGAADSAISAASENQAEFTINLNAASAAELERLPGVGKVLADRIVTHRERYGPFRRVEHLLMVRGVSDRKFRELRSMVTVN